MLKDLEILRKTEITREASEMPQWFCVVFAVLLIVYVVWALLPVLKDKGGFGFEGAMPLVTGGYRMLIGGLVLIVVLLIAGMVTKCSDSEVGTGRYQYEVLIEDESVLKELYKDYDVVDVKGKIYTLEERD